MGVNDAVLGTCGNCGGPVTTPGMWHSVTPAPKQCSVCGAHAADHGPVIPMGPSRSAYPTTCPDGTIDKRIVNT